jgi:uncharacterized integral membrane protein
MAVRVLFWLVTALVALVCVDFAYWNRAAVTVTLWPVWSFDSRLYLVILLSLLAGLLVGLLVAWIWSWGARRAAWQRARRIEVLERDLAAAEQKAKGTAVVLPQN